MTNGTSNFVFVTITQSVTFKNYVDYPFRNKKLWW